MLTVGSTYVVQPQFPQALAVDFDGFWALLTLCHALPVARRTSRWDAVGAWEATSSIPPWWSWPKLAEGVRGVDLQMQLVLKKCLSYPLLLGYLTYLTPWQNPKRAALKCEVHDILGLGWPRREPTLDQKVYDPSHLPKYMVRGPALVPPTRNTCVILCIYVAYSTHQLTAFLPKRGIPGEVPSMRISEDDAAWQVALVQHKSEVYSSMWHTHQYWLKK